MAKRKTKIQDASAIKKRKVISLELKCDLIQKHERGMSISAIGRTCGINSTTVHNILKRADTYKEKSKATSTLSGNIHTTRNRSVAMIEMERILSMWMEECNQKQIPLSTKTIKTKALALFSDMKENATENGIQAGTDEKFVASCGWFNRYKMRSKFKMNNVQITRKDKAAALKYPDILNKIVEEGWYCDQQIFNVNETSLFWKEMPSKTFANDEKAMLGFNAADRLTLILGGNAEGDFKLKPMLVYRAQNPKCLKGYNQHTLPVIWRANENAWVTKVLFEDWFTSYFCPAVEKYCKDNNLSNKVLLILDNSPGHPTALGDLCENVKVIFLPPNITSLLQPMDQGIIATFNANYLRTTFKQAILETTGDNAISLVDFWKKYNLKDAIQNIDESWLEVTASNMRAGWKQILPPWENDFDGFQENGKWKMEQIPTVLEEEITDIGRELGLDELDTGDVRELLESPAEHRDNDLNMEQQHAYEELDQEEDDISTAPAKEPTLRELDAMLSTMDTFKKQMMDADPNIERSTQVGRNLENDIMCYRRLYEEKKKSKNGLETRSTYFSKKINT